MKEYRVWLIPLLSLLGCLGGTPLVVPSDAASNTDGSLTANDGAPIQTADASGNTTGMEAPIGILECRPVQGRCPSPCLPVHGQWIDETRTCRGPEVLLTCRQPPQGGNGGPTSPGCARRMTDGMWVFLTDWYHLDAPEFYGYGRCEGANPILMRDWPLCQ